MKMIKPCIVRTNYLVLFSKLTKFHEEDMLT